MSNLAIPHEAIPFIIIVTALICLLFLCFCCVNRILCFKDIDVFSWCNENKSSGGDESSDLSDGSDEEGDDVFLELIKSNKASSSKGGRPQDGAGEGGLSYGATNITTNFQDDKGKENTATTNNNATTTASLGALSEDPAMPDEDVVAHIKMSLKYDLSFSRLFIYLISARIAGVDDYSMTSQHRKLRAQKYVFHVSVFPKKKNRFKTNQLDNHKMSQIQELFEVKHIRQAEIPSTRIRIRVYSAGGGGGVDGAEGPSSNTRVKRGGGKSQAIIGEKFISLSDPRVDLTGEVSWQPLHPPQQTSAPGSLLDVGNDPLSTAGGQQPSSASSQPLQLQVGLCFSPVTGRLIVDVIGGRGLTSPFDMTKQPDSYVGLNLLVGEDNEPQQKFKTKTIFNNPSPVYDESFLLQVPHYQISQVTLLLTVFARRGKSRKKHIAMGYCSFGKSSNSGVETNSHWQEMLGSRGQQVKRWHQLLS